MNHQNENVEDELKRKILNEKEKALKELERKADLLRDKNENKDIIYSSYNLFSIFNKDKSIFIIFISFNLFKHFSYNYFKSFFFIFIAVQCIQEIIRQI